MHPSLRFIILIENGFNTCITFILMNSMTFVRFEKKNTTNNHNDDILKKNPLPLSIAMNGVHMRDSIEGFQFNLKWGLILMWRVCKHMHALSSLLLNKSQEKKYYLTYTHTKIYSKYNKNISTYVKSIFNEIITEQMKPM